jgi:proteasome assembly chaperone (PAC2) family protein
LKVTGKKFIYFTFPMLIVLMALVYFLFIQKNPLSRVKKATEDFNYIIITVDTLRADRIGDYALYKEYLRLAKEAQTNIYKNR